MKRRRREQRKSGAPGWMVTYSDMVTLILVFFVLLFSMSHIDQIKFESVTRSFQDRAILDFLDSVVPSEDISGSQGFPDEDGIDGFDGEGGGDGNEDGDEDAESEEDEEVDPDRLMSHLKELERRADALARLMDSVESFLEEENLGDLITANRTEEGVVLVLQDSILFDNAEAEILESGEPFLNEVGSLLEDIPNLVRVEGHTDSRPINTYRYPSNWELSGARASSVIRYLIDNFDIDSDRMALAGYGDIRPAAPNDTAENMAKNRRVEIVILDTETEEGKIEEDE